MLIEGAAASPVESLAAFEVMLLEMSASVPCENLALGELVLRTGTKEKRVQVLQSCGKKGREALSPIPPVS